ncbi:3,4-dihydroxy-2-butanone-4-phosphate synthase [Chitinimonas lacunae]|uniref:3,4-dihydroxy-2-butanone 4-phosphate synthase n=1 Tax=Chitinimonas lacunae TaxID=1963018 RepID=A0ABV8MQD8_9NEIS
MSTFQHYFTTTTAAQRVVAAIESIRQGRAVVLLDDQDREDEADLIVAAEALNQTLMAQLIRDCSGIVCLCLGESEMSRLGLPMMVADNRSRHGTAFTVSIEARHGVSTGVSAADRVRTIEAALQEGAAGLVSPGHVFPLRARAGGVLARRGHTEGSVDLARLAGWREAAVLCELMDDAGEMLRGDRVIAYAARHGLTVATVADLVSFLEPSAAPLAA